MSRLSKFATEILPVLLAIVALAAVVEGAWQYYHGYSPLANFLGLFF